MHSRYRGIEERPYEPPNPPPEGKIGRGFRMLGDCWSYLRERPRLMVLPATGASLAILSCLIMCTGIGLIGTDVPLALVIAGAVAGSFVFSFIANFLAVAFLCLVADDMNGHDLGVRRGLAFAWSRRRSIGVWSGIATTVGLFFAAIQQIPGIGGWISTLVSWIGGLAWQLATFFVIPVLVIEEVSAREAVRRSARAFKARWGESVTADFAIYAASAILGIPFYVVLAVGIGMIADGTVVSGAVVLAIGVSGATAISAYAGAAMRVLQLSVYRQTITGEVAGPYAAPDLDRVVKPRRRWLKRA